MASIGPAGLARRRMAIALCAAAGGQALAVPAAGAGPRLAIATGLKGNTYHQIGEDLAKHVAPAAGVSLSVVPTQGSIENLFRLRYAATGSSDDLERLAMVTGRTPASVKQEVASQDEVRLALVQADVLQAYYLWAAAGRDIARQLVEPLRLILPMYAEELHFIVRKGDPMSRVHEIGNSRRPVRISAGPAGGGTAVTARTVYAKMFGELLPDDRLVFQSVDAGLDALLQEQVDVVLVVGGQPFGELLRLRKDAHGRQVLASIKFLELDDGQGATTAALRTYMATELRQAAYLDATLGSIPALAVPSFLVTYSLKPGRDNRPLVDLVRSLCSRLTVLRDLGTAGRTGAPAAANKWHEVKLEPAFDPGDNWRYLEETSRVLSQCPEALPVSACSPEEKSYGLCPIR